VDDPRGLGRVLRDPRGHVANIVEENEASSEAKLIREINAGLYAFEVPQLFDLLSAIKPAGPRREVYLTRAVELAISRGLKVSTISVPQESSIGVNTLSEAALAQSVLLSRKLAKLMASGVIIDDPASVSIDWEVEIQAGTRIYPGTILRGATRAGRECELGPHSVITDSVLDNGVCVRASWVTGSRLGEGVSVGPFAHIRPGSRVDKGARVGTHAEIARSHLGAGVRMVHWGYLGDTTVGVKTNIGAGTVVANYDGKKKWPSRIGSGAFIGSGTILVAPARVGDKATLGAGSLVPGRRAVPAGSLWAGVPARPLTKGKQKKGRKT
jgi:bifunctional UDP-N-acetylglucosamine pyrophosphorylase/glucosamine-1-phosphate N-acetyltransferase